MTDVILRISGMDCGACAVRIVRALRALPGLREVSVSDTAGSAHLIYDDTVTDLAQIARCVQRAGFAVPVETAELSCPCADAGAEARLRAVCGVRSVTRTGDSFTVTLWPVGVDAHVLVSAFGSNAVLTAQHGGEEAQQGQARQRLLRRLGLGVLLTAPLLWRLPGYVQLVLATAVLYGDAVFAVFAGQPPQFAPPCGIVCTLLVGKYAAVSARGALQNPARRLRHLIPRTATVVRGGTQTQVDADALTPRDTVLLAPGERVPVDGVVCSGACTVDASALAGASRPAEKTVGDTVLAGTLNRAGSVSVMPTAVGEATVLQRTIAALQRAQTVRTPAQARLARWAARFTVLDIVLAAGVGAVWFFLRQPGDLALALARACGVLAAACPGVAAQAAGVAGLAGIGRAAERGVLLTRGAEVCAQQTACTVRRCCRWLLAYHIVCIPLAACGVIAPAMAAVLACGMSGAVLLYAQRGKETEGAQT